MCHQLIKFLFKSDRYNTRKRWMGGLHLFILKKTFDKVPHGNYYGSWNTLED